MPATMTEPKRRLVILYPLDPRGTKVGGIETHVRTLLRHYPADFSILLVGADERGDLPLGRITPVDMGGDRRIDFLPVLHFPEEAARHTARRLRESIMLRYALALIRYYFTIRRHSRGARVSVDGQRFEFALYPVLALGLPSIQVVHGYGNRRNMDSLTRHVWFLYRAFEALSFRASSRIVCVNTETIARIERDYPRFRAKTRFLTVSVDTGVFRPTDFDLADDVFRILFSGRLDTVKDPALMFTVMATLRQRLGGRLEFHYAGTSDPERFAPFAAIRDITTCHGFLDMPAMAARLGKCHATILTSHSEGMPCVLLESLAAGRPMGSVQLPQLQPLIREGETGFLVQRRPDMMETAAGFADGFEKLWRDIRAGRLNPQTMAETAAPFSIDRQLPRFFQLHRQIQDEARSGA